ncbi:MAG: hypothetical protein GY895_03080 [Phycisphaera sp.]|nr:hypothetical protein [Phycisphaera sp.]
MTKSELIVGLMATALGTTMSTADTLIVPSEFPTIQAAIFAASDGDTIAVQPGEYSESIFVVGVELEIVAVGGPGSATIDSANAGPCVSINGVGSAGTVLDGFVVRNGASRTLGGGLLIAGVDGVSIRNCTFQTNHSDEDGGGAGVAEDATASFTDCIFEGNTAANDGGGLCILANGGFTVERCRFVDNMAGGDGGGAQVGATSTLEEDESPPRIINSVFTGNSAEVSGGGAFIISAGLSCPTFPCYVGGVYGCTFSRNTAEFGGGVDGGAAFVGAPLSVVNCILHGNSGDYPLYDNGDFEVVFTPSFLNCNVDFEGDADPRFVSELGADGVPGTGDELLELLPGSPCIDAGYVYAGGSTVLNGELDVSGRIRRIDSVFTADTGTTEGPLPIVDIGAHEFEDEDVDGTIAVWTGAGGAFDASSNWFGGVEPEVGIATWLDGPDAPETETTLRGNITIGQLFVNSGDWSMVGTNRSSVRSVSVGREGDMGKEPGSIFLGSYAGDRSSFAMTNLNLFCESLVLGRGDFEIGPSDGGGSVSISAVGSVVIATDDDTRLPSEFRGEGSVTTVPVGTLPSFWNLGVTQPTGLLGVTGNYYQSGGTLFPDTLGRLRFDLADPDQSLAVTGTARLGGPVEFEFDPLDPPKLEVGETFEIVTATDGFDGTTFSLARTSGIGGGLFLTLQTNDSLGGTGSSVVATVNSAEELLLGDSENEATDAVVDAIVVDLDGVDGPDLVLSVPNTADPTGSTGSLVILLNQGVTGSSWDGFEAYGSAIAISVGRNPAGLDAGDVDGDGDIDLAVANRSDGTVSILENDGTGTSFTKTDVDSQPNLAGNADPLDVYIGDLDGDGDADLAVTNGADGSVVAFANQTSPFGGGFGGVDGGTESDPGSKITTFDPGQADGKDRDDRVKGASSGGNSVKSSSTAPSAGGGIVLTWETNSVGGSPVDIAVGLLDGDGLPDVATADEVGGTISILLNDPSPSETYFPAITVSIGDSPISIDIGDLDGDGDSDIGVICEDAAGDRVLRVVQNMLVESGQFALSVLATDSLVGQEPFLLRIRNVDVDASGIGDVVALTGNSALTGDPADGFGALLGLGKSVPCVGDINLDGIVNAADLGLLIGAWGNKGGAADLNGDGLVTAADLGLLIGGWGPCPDGLGD